MSGSSTDRSAQSSVTATASPGAGAARPEFRVAAFHLNNKFQRILEIVFRHARHNPYQFVLAPAGGAADFDVALVDMTAEQGADTLKTLRNRPQARPVVTVGRRADPTRACDDLLMQRFALNLLGVLNGAVERHLLAPAQRGAAAAARALAAWASRPDAETVLGRPARALMVDENPAVRRQLALALEQMGIESEGVGSVREALDVVAVRRYELVFVEAALSDGDGLRLTRDLKRDPALRGTAVIVLTRRSGMIDLFRGALSGCDAYLVKPVTLQTLRETVERCLRRALAAVTPSGGRAAPA